MPHDEIRLPPEIQSLLDEEQADRTSMREEQLRAIGQIMARKRDEAKNARTLSGIEDIWLRAEESYLGIDDANRGEFMGLASWGKPVSMTAPLNLGASVQNEGRSTAFVKLTARYVDAGSAKIGEILLPLNDTPFSLKPTPIPDLAQAESDTRQLVHAGQPLQRDATPTEAAALAGQPPPPRDEANPLAPPTPPLPPSMGTGPSMPLTVSDLAKEQRVTAEQAAKKAQIRISDWMTESHYSSEMRQVIHDACRLGVGVLKGPFPKVSKAMSVTKGAEGFTVEMVQKVVPCYERKDPWNIFPDRNCGESMQHGEYIFERDLFSATQLLALRDDPTYIASQIDLVIHEGPNARYEGNSGPYATANETRYEVWFYYGAINQEDFETIQSCHARKPSKSESPRSTAMRFVIVTLVNQHVIRAVLNPLDSGAMPYHAMPWRKRAGSWAGVGVAEQVALPQRIVNGSTRALLDNAGLSSGVQIVLDREAIEPADGVWGVGRNKMWLKKTSSSVDDMRKAYYAFSVPNLQPQLQSVVEYGFRLAEESSSIPLITQGQSGKTTPNTLGGMQLQDNNANQLLRSIGYDFDNYITRPVVEQSYEYLLLDPDVPADEKGDYQIQAQGSIALIEQAIHDQFLIGLGPIVENPAYGINPKLWFGMVAKSKHINPESIQYTESEVQQMQSAPPAKPIPVQVEEIRAQVDMAIAQARQQTDQQRIQADTDRDTVYVQSETQRTTVSHQVQMAELASRERLAMLDYANRHQISLEELKAQLAQTTMKLQTQKELSLASLEQKQTPTAMTSTPPTEPTGLAPDGQAYQA